MLPAVEGINGHLAMHVRRGPDPYNIHIISIRQELPLLDGLGLRGIVSTKGLCTLQSGIAHSHDFNSRNGPQPG